MNNETLINQTLRSYHDRIKELLPELEFKQDNQKNHNGFNYKYITRDKSHHWISFGIIHHPKLEFWFNIGAIKFEDDFNPIKDSLLRIKDSKEEFQILEKKGQFFIRAGVIFGKFAEEDLKKGLENILDVAKYALKELEGTGFLGQDSRPIINSLDAKKLVCSNCQAELESNFKFCSSCGEKINDNKEIPAKSSINNHTEKNEKLEEEIQDYWNNEQFEKIVTSFEKAFDFNKDVLEGQDTLKISLVVIHKYLWSLYKVDKAEEAMVKSKGYLSLQGCFNFNDLQLPFLIAYSSIIRIYAVSAQHVKNIDEMKDAVELFKILNHNGEYDEILEGLEDLIYFCTTEELTKYEKNVFKISFVCKTNKKIKTSFRGPIEKGSIINGYFRYVTDADKLTKNDCVNILYSKCNIDIATRHYYDVNRYLFSSIDGWENLTAPIITEIKLEGKESRVDMYLTSDVEGTLWSY